LERVKKGSQKLGSLGIVLRYKLESKVEAVNF
jgi:hypothetical protein